MLIMTDKDLRVEYNDILAEFKHSTFKHHFRHITEPCIALLRSNGYSVYRHRIAPIIYAPYSDELKETFTVYNRTSFSTNTT